MSFIFADIYLSALKQGDPLSPILFNLPLQKVIQRIKMVLIGIKIGKEQVNILAYADDIVQGGSNMTGTDFFFKNHNCQTLTCTCQSSTYSPSESTYFFPTFWKHPDALFKKGLVVGGVSTPEQSR
jgi:hypothetical protein